MKAIIKTEVAVGSSKHRTIQWPRRFSVLVIQLQKRREARARMRAVREAFVETKKKLLLLFFQEQHLPSVPRRGRSKPREECVRE